MASWTMQYLFGDDEGDDWLYLRACLYFVTTDKTTLEDKISNLLGPVKKNKSRSQKSKPSQNISKKAQRKEENDWLDEQVALVESEKVVIEKKKQNIREKSAFALSTLFEQTAKKVEKRLALKAMIEHSRALYICKVFLAKMISDWVMDIRRLLGTHRESKAALDWDIEEKSGWWRSLVFKVGTTAQMNFTKIIISMAFESKKNDLHSDFYSTADGFTWDVWQYVHAFKMKWRLHLRLENSKDIYKNPLVVPFEIGKIMLPKNCDYHQHFEVGHSQILMPGKEGTDLILELIYTLINRKFTKEEDEKFYSILNAFLDEWSDNSGRFYFMCSCSADGIILMAGISPECRQISFFENYLIKFLSCTRRRRRIARTIASFIIDPTSTNIKIHPLFSVAGFSCIPDFLPESKISARSIIHFC